MKNELWVIMRDDSPIMWECNCVPDCVIRCTEYEASCYVAEMIMKHPDKLWSAWHVRCSRVKRVKKRANSPDKESFLQGESGSGA